MQRLNIVYIVNLPIEGNKDEDYICSALLKQGHSVRVLDEKDLLKNPSALFYFKDADLVLFHKWNDLTTLSRFRESATALVVCWYFDLVDWLDSTLVHRCNTRKRFMRGIEGEVDLILCTDGDWAKGKPKYQILRQGTTYLEDIPAEDATYLNVKKDIDILMLGIGKGGGSQRESFVNEMKRKYRRKFSVVERGVYLARAADLIQRAKIVVCPDSPVTDLYWSNRVYHMVGQGGFVLHYQSKGLRMEYHDGKHLVFYTDRADLHNKIEYYLQDSTRAERDTIAIHGAVHTRDNYTYNHRVAQLIERVNRLRSVRNHY